jgi:hypothetical protein
VNCYTFSTTLLYNLTYYTPFSQFAGLNAVKEQDQWNLAVAEYDSCINVPGLNNWFCNPTSKAADISTCKPVVYTKSTIKGVIADAAPESLAGTFRCGAAAGAVSPAQTNAVETRAGNPLARDDATPAEIAASEAEAVANAPLSNKTD